MTPPPTLPPSSSTSSSRLTCIPLVPLTPSSFHPFGTAISPPFPPNMSTPPKSPATIPTPLYRPHQPAAVLANQDSALKTSPISLFQDKYAASANRFATPQMSMFSCFPRNRSGIGMYTSSDKTMFKVNILERHPFTTQTFAPLGLSSNQSESGTVFLVVVAPSLPDATTVYLPDSRSKTIHNPPDLSHLSAFIAHGNQAVTYAAGTWHAPMVVLGQRRVDFLVTQFVNGVAEDDCQEVLLGENAVCVELDGLGLKLASGIELKAKL